MMLGARTGAWQSVDKEDEMYKELYNSLVSRTTSGSIRIDSEKVGTYGMAYLPQITDIDAINLKSIDTYGFFNDTNLQTINCPNILTIGNFCFYGCSKLTDINNGNRVRGRLQGNSQFQGCTSLKHIEIELTLGAIGANTFNGDTSLEFVKFTGSKIYKSNGTSTWSGIGTGSSTVEFASNSVSEIRAIANIMNGLKVGTTVVCSDGQFII